MTCVLIGSTAMRFWFPSSFREPKDEDYLCSLSRTHIGSADIFWDDRLEAYEWATGGFTSPATPDELLTIKTSHAYWELPNGSWNKHMWDLVYLQDKGAKVVEPLHDLLRKVWAEKHGKKKVDLSKDAANFFKDAVRRKYDHDSLHASVAYYDAPLYERLVAPGATVAMDMGLLKAMDHDTRTKLFREEVYATALERIVIPRDYRCSPGAAYAWALRRTITSLTKGWSARWLVDNYKEMCRADVDYVKVHLANRDKLILLEA